MHHIILAAASIFLFVGIRCIGKRWLFGYILGGLAFGIYNEICFEFCWNYSPLLAPMIWRDVPLFVVTGWGLVGGLALCLSDRLIECFNHKTAVFQLLSDVVFFSIFGNCVEILMSRLHFWEYNNPLLHAPWAQILGYAFVGVLVSSAGRRLQKSLDGLTSVK
jgi:hypothetical protein